MKHILKAIVALAPTVGFAGLAVAGPVGDGVDARRRGASRLWASGHDNGAAQWKPTIRPALTANDRSFPGLTIE